ncbi:hypothetical protein LCGC14_0972500 [marine sediment metagenome]|uniref:Uncharacterized protein n=1 Tax=marine sediment metagenome TaxID=412755 RepID=A0A0F9RHQ9_9ZZZZ
MSNWERRQSKKRTKMVVSNKSIFNIQGIRKKRYEKSNGLGDKRKKTGITPFYDRGR